jgi:hypothetical protein
MWNQSLYAATLSSGKKQLLVKTALEFGGTWKRIDHATSVGDWIAYSIDKDIYVVKKDGTGLKKLN